MRSQAVPQSLKMFFEGRRVDFFGLMEFARVEARLIEWSAQGARMDNEVLGAYRDMPCERTRYRSVRGMSREMKRQLQLADDKVDLFEPNGQRHSALPIAPGYSLSALFWGQMLPQRLLAASKTSRVPRK